jgi:hypothetical protein
MGESGELNVGQLARERHGGDAVSVVFSTYTGTVTAASEWDGMAERKRVRPGLPGSYEELFHSVGMGRFLLVRPPSGAPRLERAIGVIYRPESERISHYFSARLNAQFDAVIHIDETRAVEPLERTPEWATGLGVSRGARRVRLRGCRAMKSGDTPAFMKAPAIGMSAPECPRICLGTHAWPLH